MRCSAAKYLEGEQDPVMREALRLQMMEFGRTPRQVSQGAAGWPAGCRHSLHSWERLLGLLTGS